jgi:hypothetical protein
VPVFFVNRATGVLPSRSHGYVMVGDPGRGRNSGAVFYGVGGDPKRGGVDVDKSFQKKVESRSWFKHKYSSEIRSTISGMRGTSYSTKEEFHEAYRDARNARGGASSSQIDKEVSRLHRLVPKNKMEMWPKPPNGPLEAHPNTAEADVRAFENYRPTRGFNPVALRPVPNVRSIDLLEQRQQFSLHQRYLDEQHGRVGDGLPHPRLRPPEQREGQRLRSANLAASTPTFQRLPPLRSETVANCNAGAASLLQSAMDRFPNEQQRGQVQNASILGLGYQHRMRMWDPVRNQLHGPALPPVAPMPAPPQAPALPFNAVLGAAVLGARERRRELQAQRPGLAPSAPPPAQPPSAQNLALGMLVRSARANRQRQP